MSAVTWGSLAKTINDSQTIAAYIAAKFATHNADESAHGQSDEAVYNHRIAAILDHLDESVETQHIASEAVNASKIINDKWIVNPNWESSDAMTIDKSASSVLNLGVGGISVECIASASQHIYVAVNSPAYKINFGGADINFETQLYLISGAPGSFYIGCGNLAEDFIGFKITSNENTYAVWVKGGVEYSQLIDDTAIVESRTRFSFRTNGSTNIEFYIEGVLAHTATTNLPNDNWIDYPINILLTNTASGAVEVGIFSTRFFMDY
jgi:hypothetical protein